MLSYLLILSTFYSPFSGCSSHKLPLSHRSSIYTPMYLRAFSYFASISFSFFLFLFLCSSRKSLGPQISLHILFQSCFLVAMSISSSLLLVLVSISSPPSHLFLSTSARRILLGRNSSPALRMSPACFILCNLILATRSKVGSLHSSEISLSVIKAILFPFHPLTP